MENAGCAMLAGFYVLRLHLRQIHLAIVEKWLCDACRFVQHCLFYLSPPPPLHPPTSASAIHTHIEPKVCRILYKVNRNFTSQPLILNVQILFATQKFLFAIHTLSRHLNIIEVLNF